jgi:hypothetical protein
VYYVPGFKENVISIAKLIGAGHKVDLMDHIIKMRNLRRFRTISIQLNRKIFSIQEESEPQVQKGVKESQIQKGRLALQVNVLEEEKISDLERHEGSNSQWINQQDPSQKFRGEYCFTIGEERVTKPLARMQKPRRLYKREGVLKRWIK